MAKVFTISKDPELLLGIRNQLKQKQFNDDEEYLADYFLYLAAFGNSSDADLIQPHMEHSLSNVRHASWQALSMLHPHFLMSWSEEKWPKRTFTRNDKSELTESVLRSENILLTQSNIL